jgi:hypothetical protein
MQLKHTFLVAILAAAAGSFVAYAAGEGGKSCGQMTAESAPMPAKIAELMTAYADEADAHAAFMASNKDKNAQAEADGLKKLATQYRETAASLTKTADAMKAAAAWPNVPHDMKKMHADAKLKAAMDKTMALQKEFGEMVAKMSGPPAPPAAPATPAKK